jgi:hypothetical protein
MLVIYLDTNHLSHVARYPEQADSRTMLTLLERGDYHLGVSLLHIQELSAPTFSSRRAVGSLLDQVPVAWAPSPDDVFEMEVRWGIERALSGVVTQHQVFSISFVEALGAPQDANIPVSEMLEAMADRSDLREHLREAAAYGVLADSHFKRTAAVVRTPEEPILSHIRDLNVRQTPAGVTLPHPYPPEEILRRAGGLSGFPANNVAHSLARVRLKDDRFRTEENDLIDEWHACYSPYCIAVALDRRTAARFRTAHLLEANRVTHRLADLPAILERATPPATRAGP